MYLTTISLVLACFSAQCSSFQVSSIEAVPCEGSCLSGTKPEIIDAASISTTHFPDVIRRCEGEIVKTSCVTTPPKVEKKPVEVLVVNIIPQANQTQPTPTSQSSSADQPPPTSDTPTPEPPASSPTSAAPNPQSKVIVQQNVNLPNEQPGLINGPISCPFGGSCAGGCRACRCGFISPMTSALRAGLAARFGARLGF